MDKHIFFTLLSRSWSIVAAAITIILLPHWIDQVHQGYYYTFLSLLGLTVFFELGLNQVIIQFVAHEAAKRDASSANGLDTSKLESLVYTAKRWYLVAAVFFLIIGFAAGTVLFMNKSQLSAREWLVPWGLVVSGTAINLALSSRLAVLEGLGMVSTIYKLRLSQSFIGYSLMWIAMSAGAGLWAVCATSLTAAAATIIFIRKVLSADKVANRIFSARENNHSVSWKKDILPFQWRIALSWLSGYFIFQLFTPLVFMIRGADEAGQLGMSLSIFASLTTVGVSWVLAKAPVFAGMAASQKYVELDRLFNRNLIKAVTFTAAAAAGVWLTLVISRELGIRFANRTLPPHDLISLAIVSVVNCLIFGLAAYMHAFKRDPLVWVSVASAGVTAAAIYYSAHHSVSAVALAYLASNGIFFLPLTVFAFLRFKRNLR
ncbi:hypothetical protein [uncultured Pseudacidovorax sp.]|uniref:hypothetical protein n=1 Tax=uncultured Pseudacidovorax sp. TaxID=679313 RepID=UPI0025CDA210|nr:hypothetical protein [uncultured Pseudacidovorax sp.]